MLFAGPSRKVRVYAKPCLAIRQLGVRMLDINVQNGGGPRFLYTQWKVVLEFENFSKNRKTMIINSIHMHLYSKST